MIKKLLIITLISTSLISCSSNKKELTNAATDYKKAKEMLEEKRYQEAAENFEAIYDDYPLSKWALKAQTIAAYIYFGQDKFDESIRVSQTFMELNPNSEYNSYLQYIKALSYFRMMPNVNRAQDYSKLSSYNFRELIARYPTTQYAKDAKNKIIFIDEHLAASQMNLARYQMNHQNYVGAIMHLNNVTYRFAKTKQASEAYFRLYEIYYKLGMNKEAQITKKELEKKHPNNNWLQYIKS